MLTSATSVIERRLTITETHTTHPYECGWADEAVFYVQTEHTGTDLDLRAQISPDGLHWVDIEAPVRLSASEAITAIRLTVFGGWLRLVLRGATPSSPATVLIHLALKG